MTVGGRVGALWIGGLEPYMDEAFLQNAMNMMGESGVVSIKVMTNKFTGEPAGYGFINFDSDQTAIIAMHRLGGKIIPNSNPPVRFKLNHNSTRLQPREASGAQPGGTWPGLTGPVSSPTSAGSGAPPAAATSPGPDYSAYHQYYQQYAHQQQQQYAAAWSAWQQAQQQQQQQQQP